jgi:mono/diheme cytochrome c family protein
LDIYGIFVLFFMNKLIFSLIALLFTFNACNSAADEIAKSTEETRRKNAEKGVSAPDGMAVFRANCVNCHGTDGALGLNGAKNLGISDLPLDSRIHIITNGKNLMTPFKALLNEAEIKAVAEYTLTLKTQTAK